MPHGGYHGPKKTKVDPRKQAAQSMMSAGISSLSGSTTSNKKGKEAKKIIQNFQNNNNNNSNNNNNNNNVDPIVPKPKPKPDEKKKELRLTIPGQDPDIDDRPKTRSTTGGTIPNKAKDEGPNLFGNLNYNMDLTTPSSLMANETTAPKLALQNDALKFSVEDFVMSNVPESLHDTVGASYAIVKAYIDQGFDFDVGKSGKVTLDWAKDFSIQYNVEF